MLCSFFLQLFLISCIRAISSSHNFNAPLGIIGVKGVSLDPELIAVTIQGLSFSMAMGIGPEGTFQRMQLSLQNLQIDDQLSASRCVTCMT